MRNSKIFFSCEIFSFSVFSLNVLLVLPVKERIFCYKLLMYLECVCDFSLFIFNFFFFLIYCFKIKKQKKKIEFQNYPTKNYLSFLIIKTMYSILPYINITLYLHAYIKQFYPMKIVRTGTFFFNELSVPAEYVIIVVVSIS